MSEELSRQRRWQIKMEAEGKCPRCGAKVKSKLKFKHCDNCRQKSREAYRKRLGLPLDAQLGATYVRQRISVRLSPRQSLYVTGVGASAAKALRG
jgi:tRNA(Ile2) C34 agmatinyltransferase TiaS